MSYGKAVEEVWAWRETLGKELDGLSLEQQRKHLNNKADDAIVKYGIKVKTAVATKWSSTQITTA